MVHRDSLIAERVVDTAKEIGDSDGTTEQLDDPLEVYVEANLDGSLREVYLVLCTGGPHIEVALYSGRVDGSWGGDEHSVPIMDDRAEDMLVREADRYAEQWQSNLV